MVVYISDSRNTYSDSILANLLVKDYLGVTNNVWNIINNDHRCRIVLDKTIKHGIEFKKILYVYMHEGFHISIRIVKTDDTREIIVEHLSVEDTLKELNREISWENKVHGVFICNTPVSLEDFIGSNILINTPYGKLYTPIDIIKICVHNKPVMKKIRVANVDAMGYYFKVMLYLKLEDDYIYLDIYYNGKIDLKLSYETFMELFDRSPPIKSARNI